MYLEQIPNTCSMLELCNVTKEDIDKNDFLNELNEEIEESCISNDKEISDIKAVIYNTNFDSDYRAKLQACGFKEVFDYSGNEGHTYTMMLDLN